MLGAQLSGLGAGAARWSGVVAPFGDGLVRHGRAGLGAPLRPTGARSSTPLDGPGAAPVFPGSGRVLGPPLARGGGHESRPRGRQTSPGEKPPRPRETGACARERPREAGGVGCCEARARPGPRDGAAGDGRGRHRDAPAAPARPNAACGGAGGGGTPPPSPTGRGRYSFSSNQWRPTGGREGPGPARVARGPGARGPSGEAAGTGSSPRRPRRACRARVCLRS